MYSPQVLDHFEHPRNVGDLEDGSVSVQLENPACGDILRLSVKVEDGRIVDVRYRAKGCVPSIACGSLLTELIRGKTLTEARAMNRLQIVDGIGGLPEASTHASYLAIEALVAALKQIDQAKE
jgi:NifU-like protein involved in Fe-S cluster formation